MGSGWKDECEGPGIERGAAEAELEVTKDAGKTEADEDEDCTTVVVARRAEFCEPGQSISRLMLEGVSVDGVELAVTTVMDDLKPGIELVSRCLEVAAMSARVINLLVSRGILEEDDEVDDPGKYDGKVDGGEDFLQFFT